MVLANKENQDWEQLLTPENNTLKTAHSYLKVEAEEDVFTEKDKKVQKDRMKAGYKKNPVPQLSKLN